MQLAGQRLLAHELTHVVQQGGATVRASNTAISAQQDGTETHSADGPEVEQEILDLPVFEDMAPVTIDERQQPGEIISDADIPVLNASITQADGERPAKRLFPIDHPTELEAQRIASRIVSVPMPFRVPTIREYRRGHAGLSLDTAPGQKAVKRIDMAFIMGSDKPKSRNKFYGAAVKYFKSHLAGVKIVNSPKVRNLAAVFAYLNHQKQPIGTLYIISHAAEDGSLSFPLQVGDRDRRVEYRELRTALKKSPEFFKLPKGIIDRDTIIKIKGCRLGQSERMLATIGRAFGAGKVVAPKHRQYYDYRSKITGKGKNRKVEKHSYEGFKTYFIERHGSVKLNRNEQIDAFVSKYSYLTRKDWVKLIPKRGRKTVRKVEKNQPFFWSTTIPSNNDQALKLARRRFAKVKFRPTKVTRRTETPKPIELKLPGGNKKMFKGKFIKYTFEDKHGKPGWQTYHIPADDRAIIEAIKAGESIPGAYEWRMVRKRHGSRVTYTVEGVRTVYSLNRYIVSRLGKETVTKRLYIPPEKPGEFYGEYVANPARVGGK
jgi:hypothetical protein